MRPQAALKKLTPLLKNTSFTSKEAQGRGVSSATLAYYIKHGEIVRIGHGIYRGTDAPRITDFRWEDLFEAVQKVKDGIVCLTSALALYGFTEEIPRQHWIAIRNETVHHGSPSTKVIRMRNFKLGKTNFKIGKVSFHIFDRERTIVDSFRYLGRETALKALKAALTKRGSEKIDLEKIRKYAKILHVKIEPYILAVTT